MSQENVEVVRRNLDAYARRDLEAYLETVAGSVTLQSRFSAMDKRVYRGPDGMRRYFREIDEAWERYEMEVVRLVPAGTHVAGLFRLHAIGRGSHVVLEEDPATVFILDGGKIVQIDAYKTHTEALEAVGLRD